MGICASSPPDPSSEGGEDVTESNGSSSKSTEEDEAVDFDLTNLRHNSSYANLIPLQRNTRVEETYTVTEHKLGEGLTGCVVAISHKKTGARRALKNIDLSKVNPKYVDRLRGEIEILKQLDHPNVVKLYETYEYNNTIYMVMELCLGGELYHRLVDRKGFSEAETRRYVSQMLGALSYCHSKGIAHRDIKLANFVFKNRSVDSPLKLIDFGFSATMTSNTTTFSTFVGSAYYMAPEVIGKEQYTLQCDMWGIGVIAYTLIAGYPPFMGKSEEEIERKIRTKKVQFKSKVWKSVSSNAKKFITELLNRDPQRRLTSEKAMRHPWMLELRQKKLELSKEDVHALRRFGRYSRLKQIGLVVMAHFADRDMVSQVVKTFTSVDADSSGRIDLDEMIDELKRYGVSEEEASTIFHSIDQDSSGSVRFSEFLAPMLEDHVSTKEICTEIFSLMDADKKGYITRDYFGKMLHGLVDPDMIDKIMSEADSDGDGKIDLNEFTAIMLGDRKGREDSPVLTSLDRPSTSLSPLASRQRSSSLIAVHYTRSHSEEIHDGAKDPTTTSKRGDEEADDDVPGADDPPPLDLAETRPAAKATGLE